MVALLAILVYLNLPDGSGDNSDGLDPPISDSTAATADTSRKTGSAPQAGAKQDDYSPTASCEKQHGRAQKFFSQGQLQQGLEQLMECAELNPKGAREVKILPYLIRLHWSFDSTRYFVLLMFKW